jgi:hypothetical protein
VIAYKYEIEIAIDLSNTNMNTLIVEYFIPEMEIYFNFFNGLNVFEEDDNRFKNRHGGYVEKELNKQIIFALTNYLTAQDFLFDFEEEL